VEDLFADLHVVNVQGTVLRNIVSLRVSQNLFDDLSADPAEQRLALQVEDAVKPLNYQSATPIIHRPFEEAEWFNAIGYPFKQWSTSRYSDGSFGVWYGADSLEATVFETAYHWYTGLLADAEDFSKENVAVERKVYNVECSALLLDLKPQAAAFPTLLHKTDYTFTQQVGARIQREGHPGLLTTSVRYPKGTVSVIFNPAVLSSPKVNCVLTYQLKTDHIAVEKRPRVTWRRIELTDL
jgi:hypothetical protein